MADASIKISRLAPRFFLKFSDWWNKLRGHLAQGSYAAYAQHLMHQAAFFQDGHLLQVGLEVPPGGTMQPI